VAFDPASFVLAGDNPFQNAWKLLKNYTEDIQIRDLVRGSGDLTLPGEGDAELEPILKDAVASGFDGYVSLESRLSMTTSLPKLSPEERFRLALASLREIAQRAGMSV
jgi:sugar phosphate isomerase/epimerase